MRLHLILWSLAIAASLAAWKSQGATASTPNPWSSQTGIVTVAWDHANATDSFRVYFSEQSDMWIEYLEAPPGVRELSIVGLDPRKVWHLVCTAISPSGIESLPSDSVVWDPQPPSQPNNLRITKVEITTTLAP